MRVIYKANDFPILQNRVYRTEDEALNCKRGDIKIVIDQNNFIYNLNFDSKRMDYDQEYDNSVPSNFFRAYYSRIIFYLIDKYKLDTDSVILDIGCGKGTFLKQMFADGNYDGKGIGIDPSYDGDLNYLPGKLTFIREYFDEKHLDKVDNVSIIILRHTLEHIPNPSLFLSYIFSVISKCNFKNVPIFIEVPDVEWIFKNRAYWDFFYEHVNYFSKRSLFECLTNSGAIVRSIITEFGDQYLWAEAIINCDNDIEISLTDFDYQFDFDIDFNNEIISNIQKIEKAIETNSNIVIWGMASKGILFSFHLIRNCCIPRYFVDINPNKQGKYIPIIAKKIISPNELPLNEKMFIICMNPNYVGEVFQQCKDLNIDFKLFTPNIDRVNI